MLSAADDRTDRVCEHALYGGLLFLQVSRDAAEGSAAAGAGHKVVNVPVELAVDLRPRGLVVRLRIGRVVELL